MAQKTPPNTCVSCKKTEAPDVRGAKFTSNGDNGMVVIFWMCERCAIANSPGQGPITLEDPTTRV